MGLSIVRKFSFSYSSLISDFVDRVLLDGGIVDTTAYLNNTESTATVIMNTSAYKDGILYSFKPNDGTGDFTFTRGSAGTRVNKLGFLENVQVWSEAENPTDSHKGIWLNVLCTKGKKFYSIDKSFLLNLTVSNMHNAWKKMVDFDLWKRMGTKTHADYPYKINNVATEEVAA